MLELKGSLALVTGASRGIGRATATLLARSGADVVLNYRSDEEAARAALAGCVREGVRALAVRADVSHEDEVARLFEEADTLGTPDLVVANAGIWEGAAIEEMGLDAWERALAQNLTSVFLTVREAVRRMKPRRHGSIVVISSTAGQRGEAFHSAYAATKGAAISLVRSLAAELGPHGLRVNGVAPGWVMTDMSRDAIEADHEAILQGIPLGRVAQPEDIAPAVVFLLSPLARHITGEVLSVNGGSVLA